MSEAGAIVTVLDSSLKCIRAHPDILRQIQHLPGRGHLERRIPVDLVARPEHISPTRHAPVAVEVDVFVGVKGAVVHVRLELQVEPGVLGAGLGLAKLLKGLAEVEAHVESAGGSLEPRVFGPAVPCAAAELEVPEEPAEDPVHHRQIAGYLVAMEVLEARVDGEVRFHGRLHD